MEFLMKDLSPTGNDIGICVSFRFYAKSYDWNAVPTSFGLKISIKNSADTMLIKVPVSIGNLKATDLKNELLKNDVAGVRFKNLKIWTYQHTNKRTKEQKTIYTGTADDFEIIY
ncbi:MAG: hypothetical protein J6B94_06760 [Lachnospiraceae bacterium]|nr:hypothetical protein [Lachnospiraceae bacterium]